MYVNGAVKQRHRLRAHHGASRRAATDILAVKHARARVQFACKAERDGASSSYTDSSFSSKASKALVSRLTAVVNAVVPPKKASASAATLEARAQRPPLEPADVLEGVREDFTTNCYLWTGNITENIYSEGAPRPQLNLPAQAI